PLCGHATLASLLALGHWGLIEEREEVRFHSRSGPLAARLEPGGGARRGSIDLPSGRMRSALMPAALETLLERSGLGAALGYWTSPLGYVVALLDPKAPLDTVRSLAAELEEAPRQGLVLMQAQPSPAEAVANPALVAGQPVDYRLRFFAPGLGIPEDPVTGSAHALVAPWWQERCGRSRVVGWQCSDRPGGVVCEGLPSGKIRLFGSGHLLWDGTLHTQTREPHGAGSAAGQEASATGYPRCGWSVLRVSD
ncbi:MAG: PhzF family phenazine biosynthesis protein, partial [Cyanobium sp.]